MVEQVSDLGVQSYPLRVWQDLDVGSRVKPCDALALFSQANQRKADRG